MGFLDDLAERIRSLRQPSGEVWFRGQADASWPLVPRLLRGGLSADQERNMFARFRYRAMGMMQNHPADTDAARWQFLMQHHGLPTRLLDWSEASLSALFFAISGQPNADGRLFILVPMMLNEQQLGERVLIAPTVSPCSDILVASFRGVETPETIIASSAYSSHDRLVRQRSGFTVHGVSTALETIASPPALSSILIPASLKTELTETLAHMGITRTTLFHDLDALAFELREQYRLS